MNPSGPAHLHHHPHPHPARRAALGGACAALLLGVAGAVLAHAEHGRPEHGGVVAEAGVFQGELVSGAAGLVLHLSDHGAPVSTAGASAKLTVLAAGRRSEIALTPAGANRFAAPAGTTLPAGAKVVAAVALPDGRRGALRFELK